MSERKWHHPSIWGWMLVVIGFTLLVRLGIWQLQRADEKSTLLAAFSAATDQPTQNFPTVHDNLSPAYYPHVRVRGRYDLSHGYLLDNTIRHGVSGVEVFVPFTPNEDKTVLLVNRGWIARPGNTRAIPEIPALPQGEIELHGIYAPLPGSGIRLGGNALSQQTQWPKLTIYLDANEVSVDLGVPLYPRQLLLDKDSDASPTLVREWMPAMMPPAKHRAYAFQWFALAAASVVIFLLLHYRKINKN